MVDTWMERVCRGILAVSAALMAVMVGIVAINVVSRYLLHTSLTWSSELARYCMVWSALLAAAVLVYRGQHLALDVFDRWVPARLKRGMRLLIGALSMIFFAVGFVSGVLLVVKTIGQTSASVEFLPMSAVYAIMPISAFLMFLGAGVATLDTREAEDQDR